MSDDDLRGDCPSQLPRSSSRDHTSTVHNLQSPETVSNSTSPPLEVAATPAKDTQRHQSSDSRDSGFVETTEDQRVEIDTEHVNRPAGCGDGPTTETLSASSSNTDRQKDNVTLRKPASATLDGAEGWNVRKRTSAVKPCTLNISVPNNDSCQDFLRARSPSSPNLNSSVTRGDCFEGMGSPRSLSPPGSFNFTPTYAKIRHFAQSPVTKFRQTPIGMDPYMSPILASDELLQGLCPVTMVVSLLIYPSFTPLKLMQY